jgi:hypothetical protein
MKNKGARPSRKYSLYLAGCVALLLAAAALRILGAQNDLWLDEIWSLDLASKVSSPLEVFTKIHHDNNHYLNTLWLYFFGQRGNWFGYRILSLVTGVGTVALAGLIGRGRNRASSVLAMLLTGFSYVLVLYSSEARGFAPVVFFSFLSYYLLDRYLEKRRWQSAVLFSVSAVFGLLSHLIFLNVILAALLWSAFRLIRSRAGLGQTMIALFSCYALPLAFLAVLYFVDVRYLVIGGGTRTNLLSSYLSSLAWALGTPFTNPLKILTCIFAVTSLAAGIQMLWREKSDSFLFYASAILVVPILLAIIRHADVLYVRYFIVGIAFLLILFSFVLASLYYRGPYGKAVCFVVLTCYLIANGLHLASLFKYGRGHYRDAIRFLVEHSKDPVVTIGSDHDFRIPIVLRFYLWDSMGERSARYYEQGSWPATGLEWIILHKQSAEEAEPPPRQFVDRTGHRYELAATFPTAPLSGLHWFVYHNTAR